MSIEAGNDALDDPLASTQGVGQSLRRLREAKGWSADDVSARVKFSVRQIDALESERWDELPKGLSLRGLVRNYARMLGADAEALIAAVESQVGAMQASHEPLIPAVPPRALYPERETGGSLIWIVAILMVFGVALGYAFHQGWLPQQWLPTGWFTDVAS